MERTTPPASIDERSLQRGARGFGKLKSWIKRSQKHHDGRHHDGSIVAQLDDNGTSQVDNSHNAQNNDENNLQTPSFRSLPSPTNAQCATCRDFLIELNLSCARSIPFHSLALSSDHGICQGCCLLFDGILAMRGVIQSQIMENSSWMGKWSFEKDLQTERDEVVKLCKEGAERIGTDVPDPGLTLEVLEVRISTGPTKGVRLGFIGNIGSEPYISPKWQMSAVPGKPTPWNSAYRDFAKFPGNTSSEEGAQWVLSRLQDCQVSHRELCLMNANSPLPKRVLHIGKGDVGVDVNHLTDLQSGVSLYETKGELAPYVCLSHRWRPISEMTRTTGSTIQSYLQNIPWSDLTKTFKDAILFTRRLGIRYIWIDSLCIIQDNAEDWTEQSLKMWSIYAGSTLTLFASGAQCKPSNPMIRNDTDGLFWTATTLADRLSLRPRNHDIDSWEVRIGHPSLLSHDILTIAHPGLRQKSIAHSPLLRRGWVYQERLLSPRILHFGPDELIWECAVIMACECKHRYESYHVPQPKADHANARLAQLLSLSAAPLHNDGAKAVLVARWHKIVEEYSGLDLTFPSDKLPALAGLARQFHSLGSYYAGLWENSFLEDLMWQRSEVQDQMLRPAHWHAPSWSWASITGKASYDRVPQQKPSACFTVLQRSVTPLGSGDEFGRLAAARLIVAGRIVRVRSAGLNRRLVRSESSGSINVSWDVDLVVDGRDKRTRRMFLFELARTGARQSFALLLWQPNEEPDVLERIGCSRTPHDMFDGVKETLFEVV